NLKQLTLATLNCAQDHQDQMPPSFGFYPPGVQPWSAGVQYGPPFFHILDYMDGATIRKGSTWARANPGGGWGTLDQTYWYNLAPGGRPKTFSAQTAPTNTPHGANTSSGFNSDPFSPNADNAWNSSPRSSPASFTDGSSQTIIYGEQYSKWSSGGWQADRQWLSGN